MSPWKRLAIGLVFGAAAAAIFGLSSFVSLPVADIAMKVLGGALFMIFLLVGLLAICEIIAPLPDSEPTR